VSASSDDCHRMTAPDLISASPAATNMAAIFADRCAAFALTNRALAAHRAGKVDSACIGEAIVNVSALCVEFALDSASSFTRVRESAWRTGLQGWD
jgi:hypothetical protein